MAIVGIGASAGGLEACSELLRHFASDTGLALVVVQHLDPVHESRLAELLSRASGMPVSVATDRLPVKGNHVYVIPPNVSMSLDRDELRLTPRRRAGQHLPIDRFFQSLARGRQSRAIGVVLSGTGSDGTRGLQAIKEAGGVTFVQEERSARHSGMPHSAIAGGLADHVLTPSGIARELGRLARGHYMRSAPRAANGPVSKGEDAHIAEVLRVVKAGTGVDFAGYKPGTIHRRIARRMLLQKIEDVRAYARLLRRSSGEVRALHDDLLIQVTGFFRDAHGIDSLIRHVFPALVKGRGAADPIRIWVPGCATGEEAHSIVIALLEFLDARDLSVPVHMFATDLSGPAIIRARAARFPEAIEAEVSPRRLRRFFVKADGTYQVSQRVRETCVFAQHDLTRDPPFARLDLISCSNVLIYLSAPLQERAIQTFHHALKPQGFLKLGPSEGVGRLTGLFEAVDKKHKVFARRPGPAPQLGFGISARPLAAVGSREVPTDVPRSRVELEREADRLVLGRYAPAGVVVNADMEIVQFRGRTGPYLEATPGSASLHLFKMLREGLGVGLRQALNRAAREQRPVRSPHKTLDIDVLPIGDRADRHYLILFDKGGTARAVPSPPEAARPPRGPRDKRTDSQLVQVTRELAETREHLQQIIHDLEASNEELRGATEEAQSANEELQSTNEELETAKEELQATNEELTTVNDELNSRNATLNRIGNDLTNLLHSTHVPILMVGSDHRLRRMTPVAERVLGLAPSDVGRPIEDLQLSIDGSRLEALLAEVAGTLVPQERDVEARDGRWYSVRVRPYRTSEDRIEGAVISFVDVDALRRSLDQVKDARDEARAIVETLREPLVLLDGAFRIVTANRSFYTTFQVTSDETEGRAFFELGNGQWDIPALRRRLEEVLLSADQMVEDFEVAHEFEKIGLRTMKLNAGRMAMAGTGPAMILLAIDDITEPKRLEAVQEQLRQEQIGRVEAEAATRAKDRFLAVLSHELRTPLNAMLGWIRILRSQPPNAPTVARGLGVIERNVLAQARLIEDLLDMSRIIAGQLRLDVMPIMVAPVVKAAVAAMRPAGEAKQVALGSILDEDAGPVQGDPVRLQQVVQNLLDNAIKFTPSGGKVEIALARDGAGVAIRVHDTGHGIPPDRLPDLWTPHREPRDSTVSRSGLGIGLTIVRSIVELHGGTVRADSAGPGEGATFMVTLPLTDQPPVKVAARPAGAVSATAGSPHLEGVRVLLVDDEADTRELAGEILVRQGAAVEAAGSVASALEALDRAPFDVLISDLAMPEQDGYDLIRLIRAREAERGGHLPAMAVSAYAKGEDRTQAMAAGYEQFLAKPVEPVNLVRAVAILAGLGRPSAPDQSRTPPARRRGKGAAPTPDTKYRKGLDARRGCPNWVQSRKGGS